MSVVESCDAYLCLSAGANQTGLLGPREMWRSDGTQSHPEEQKRLFMMVAMVAGEPPISCRVSGRSKRLTADDLRVRTADAPGLVEGRERSRSSR